MKMKRLLVSVLVCLVYIATCLTQGLAAAANAEAAASPPTAAPKWPWFPWFHPQPHPHPFPFPPYKWPVHPFPWAHAQPPQPAKNEPHQPFVPPLLDPKVQKCLSSFHAERTCVHQILTSFWTGKLSLGADCCNTVQEVSEDCTGPIFSHLNNPFFGQLLKANCARKAAPPTN